MPKRGFKERLDDLLYSTRDHTVFHGWHPEGPELPRFTRLGYPHPARGTWYIGARTELFSQTLQECGFPLPMTPLTVTPSIPGVLLPLFVAIVRQAQRKLRLSVIQFHSSRY
jgi:hypothetical protein